MTNEAAGDADDSPEIKRHQEVMKLLAHVLHGQPGAVQGSVLGEAVALWLAGHPDYLRAPVLVSFLTLVKTLVPKLEREIFGGGQHPQNKHTTGDK